ncbi:MAG: pantoate--beta-alanine ligase [Planctomycetota bacterium]
MHDARAEPDVKRGLTDAEERGNHRMNLNRIQEPGEARQAVRDWQADGLTVGFVPTMGGLHEGHFSLIRAADDECDRTVISIFVNPPQFGEDEDLDEYPRMVDRDCRAAAEEGADMAFVPSEDEMYPQGYATYVVQERLTERLCGAHRPGHFRGVLTVVTKLLNIIPADRAYFGRKDLQQSVVIRRMVRDLNLPVNIRVMPTVREDDGLAMSCRNEYLDPDQREQATCLYRALRRACSEFREGETDPDELIGSMQEVLDGAPQARPEYVEIVDPETLEPVEKAAEDSVAALAVHLGEARLIDNMELGNPE